MTRGRSYHACAMRGKDVVVFGGESSTRNSLEVWNGNGWSYSTGPIGGTGLQLLSQGRNLYLFGGWDRGQPGDPGPYNEKLGNTIWKINHYNEFIEVGHILISRKRYALFTVPHGFLTNCQGK